MKLLPALALFAAAGLTSCETGNQPISSTDFDPLAPPGSNLRTQVSAGPAAFEPGQFVHAAVPDTAFYLKRPRGEADADKLLKKDTPMKVVTADDRFAKVELDSGEVGFVPTVMLADPNLVVPVLSDEFAAYPPLPESGPGESLPVIDPTGLPPEDAIPTVIDPDAPPATAPAPTAPVPLPPSASEQNTNQ